MVERKVWAYTTIPTRTTGSSSLRVGGPIAEPEALISTLETAANRLGEADWIEIAFRVQPIVDENGARRSNAARDLLLETLFGPTGSANDAAERLAARLEASMDQRSEAHLLVIIASVDGTTGNASLWAFPRDEAFRFVTGNQPAIELLVDIFSRTSRLRKGARFIGERSDTSFLRGRAVDYQAGRSATAVAEYWIGRFLECDLAITPVVGTEVAASAIRRLAETLEGGDARRQLNAAVIALAESPRPSWTLSEIADNFLAPELGERLLQASERPEFNHARFVLDRSTMSRLVGTRVLELESGVIVTSPVDMVRGVGTPDAPVIIRDNHLELEGQIVSDRLRGRRQRPAAG